MNKVKKHGKRVFLLGTLIFLFAIWGVISLLLINRVAFSVITYPTKNIFRSVNNYENNTFYGHFISKANHLGMIILEFDPQNISNNLRDEEILFKFREKGMDTWLHQREYSLRLFDSQSEFSFGIPVVENSKGKEYQFELAATGKKKNYIKPISLNSFITGYQYPKSEIFGMNVKTLEFIYHKTLGSFSDSQFLIRAFVYLVPLLAFVLAALVLAQISYKKKIRFAIFSFKTIYLRILILSLIFFEILMPGYFYLDSFFVLVPLWISAIIAFRFKSSVSFFLSLLLIIFWMLIIPFGLQSLQNKLNVWSYLLLVFGTIQLFIEIKYEKKNHQ